jgi:O-antigen ligase
VTAPVLRPPLGRRARLEPGTATLAAGVAALAALAAVAVGPLALAIPVAVAGGLFLVRQPLALLMLYVYMGIFKDESVVQAVPFDATVGLGVLLAGVCLVRFVSRRARLVPFGLALTIAVVGVALVASLAWTPASAYGADKAARFVTLTALAIVAPFFLVEDRSDLRRIFSWTVVLAILAAILALSHPPAEGRLAPANTIGNSQLLCAGALVLLLHGLANPARRLWATGVGLALIGVAAGVGSRGPLLSLTLALSATAAVWVLRVPRKVVPVLLAVAIGIAVAPFVSLPESSSQRLAAAASDPAVAFGRDQRSLLYEQAVALIHQQPLRGVGAGGFSSINAAAKWPHNIFLELWSELGIVPMAVVAASIIAVLVGLFRASWRISDDRARLLLNLILGLFLFYLSAVQVSGDLNENRAFWVMLGLGWLVVRHGVPPPRSPAERSGSPAERSGAPS